MKEKTFFVFLGVLFFALILSFTVISSQVNTLSFHFVKVKQEKEHNKMLEGNAGNPWQYRVLADYMVEPLINLFYKIGVDRPKPSAFILFRFVQNTLIFIAAVYYYKKLGLPTFYAFLGIAILAWMMLQAFYNSDLSLNTYFDVLFYLFAAILILEEKYLWLLPLMILAAFNRETSGLIVFMLPAHIIFVNPDKKREMQAMISFLGMGILYTGIFLGLRAYFGEQEFLTAYGYYPGKQVLYFNFLNLLSWQRILATAGIIPFLAIFSYRKWSKTLKVFFWVIVPVWGVVHFFASVVAETRLFLVPLALIFIPATLFGLQRQTYEKNAASSGKMTL